MIRNDKMILIRSSRKNKKKGNERLRGKSEWGSEKEKDERFRRRKAVRKRHQKTMINKVEKKE